MLLLELIDPTGLLARLRKRARRRLKDGVDAKVKPLLRELGFESARTRAWKSSRFKDVLQGIGWIRINADRVDLLEIRWRKYGEARFVIDYWSWPRDAWNQQSADRGDKEGRVYPQHRAWLKLAWFGEGQNAEKAVELACRRIRELDGYLKGGAMPPCIDDGMPFYLQNGL